jgi:hypothetical protein
MLGLMQLIGYWESADGEEIERLFTTGTIGPLMFQDIPSDRVITYVNPICVEKRNDDGSLKFRTRLTIGGDRIQYPYDTRAVTAEMEALKILLNAMISEKVVGGGRWGSIPGRSIEKGMLRVRAMSNCILGININQYYILLVSLPCLPYCYCIIEKQ